MGQKFTPGDSGISVNLHLGTEELEIRGRVHPTFATLQLELGGVQVTMFGRNREHLVTVLAEAAAAMDECELDRDATVGVGVAEDGRPSVRVGLPEEPLDAEINQWS
jgi:hypothetical protein